MTTRRAILGGMLAAPLVLAAGQLAPLPAVEAQQGPQRMARPPFLFGLHVPGVSTATLGAAEAQAGRQADVVLVFSRIGTPGVGTIAALQRAGYEVVLCLEWWDARKAPNDTRFGLAEIAKGTHDAAADAWWPLLASLPRPIHLRPLHEGNGNWYPWGAYNKAVNRPEQYAPAFRRIAERAWAVAGRDQIKMQWCVNRLGSHPAGVPFASTYPGADVVDELVVNGYNRPEKSASTSFEGIFRPAYDELKAIDADKPFWVGETAATEVRGDKPEWIAGMFKTLRTSMVIDVVTWFHSLLRPPGEPVRDWPFDTTPASLDAFRRGITRSRGV